MVQRYKNESKSQQTEQAQQEFRGCFQWFKDTKMKANHNDNNSAIKVNTAVSNGSKIQK